MSDIWPIGEAPLIKGERFGPVLLFGREPGERCAPYWVVGHFSEEWATEDGVLFRPTHFTYLPPAPEVLSGEARAVA